MNILCRTYREAGSFPGEVQLSAVGGDSTALKVPSLDSKSIGPQTIHVILQVQDAGIPSLFAYRRAIITIQR